LDLSAFLGGIAFVDILILLGLFGMFILGWVQGTIRRLLGIGSILFAFLFAANAREPLGEFLARYWTQFPAGYTEMLAFGGLFVLAAVGFTILIQAAYDPAPLLPRWSFLDEVLGGVLGVLQGLLILAIGLLVLDSFFLVGGFNRSEIEILRSVWEALNGGGFAGVLRDNVIPFLFAAFGFILPETLRGLYPNA
jgi:uncharacterized membrane protein required for colicin V production